MKCLNCGAELNEGDRFCQYCGKEVYQNPMNYQSNNMANNVANNMPNNTPNNMPNNMTNNMPNNMTNNWNDGSNGYQTNMTNNYNSGYQVPNQMNQNNYAQNYNYAQGNQQQQFNAYDMQQNNFNKNKQSRNYAILSIVLGAIAIVCSIVAMIPLVNLMLCCLGMNFSRMSKNAEPKMAKIGSIVCIIGLVLTGIVFVINLLLKLL